MIGPGRLVVVDVAVVVVNATSGYAVSVVDAT